jgi:hypothetical protein
MKKWGGNASSLLRRRRRLANERKITAAQTPQIQIPQTANGVGLHRPQKRPATSAWNCNSSLMRFWGKLESGNTGSIYNVVPAGSRAKMAVNKSKVVT